MKNKRNMIHEAMSDASPKQSQPVIKIEAPSTRI
jgi:hypothetical protein